MALADIPVAVAAVAEALRAAANNPADAIRCLSALVTFYPAIPQPNSPISIAQANTIIATAALCRQAALVSLARACATYQPTSYDDAVSTREAVTALFDREILAAADAGQDATYLALRQLRTSVVNDLATRGSLLPHLMVVTTKAALSTLELAYRLYGDASRADEIAQRTDVQHPGFLPTAMTLLSS